MLWKWHLHQRYTLTKDVGWWRHYYGHITHACFTDQNSTAIKEFYINFTEQQKKVFSSLHYDVDSYFFVNGVKIYKFKAKDSEINASLLYLDNFSKIFSPDVMKTTGLQEYVFDFSADYDSIDVSDILDIQKYFMKNTI